MSFASQHLYQSSYTSGQPGRRRSGEAVIALLSCLYILWQTWPFNFPLSNVVLTRGGWHFRGRPSRPNGAPSKTTVTTATSLQKHTHGPEGLPIGITLANTNNSTKAGCVRSSLFLRTNDVVFREGCRALSKPTLFSSSGQHNATRARANITRLHDPCRVCFL